MNDRFGNEAAFSLASPRRIASRTSYCAVVVWHYIRQNFFESSNIRPTFDDDMKVEKVILQEEIMSVNVSKSISASSGNFEVRIHPTENWKSKISPGDWVAIYFFDSFKKDFHTIDNPGSENMVLLGNIDRVARSLEKDQESDKTLLEYVISGRNFGKVFEETDIWFDPYLNQDKITDNQLRSAGLALQGSPDSQVSKLLDVFLGPGASFPDGKTSPLKQWQIPQEVKSIFPVTYLNRVGGDFLGDTGGVYDLLSQDIKGPLPGFNARAQLTLDSNGSLWDLLKKSSNSLINEVFVEERRIHSSSGDRNVYPTITLRPRPFQTRYFKDQFGSNSSAINVLNNSYMTLQELAQKSGVVEISPAEIQYENLGKDDHSRFNMIWLNSNYSQTYAAHPSANLTSPVGIANPMFVRESIQRYGLKRYDQLLEFCFLQGDSGGQKEDSDLTLFKAFIAQIYDMHHANHLYDAGTIQCTGVLEAELGKPLAVRGSDETKPSKLYYIEGYEHRWKFPSTWTTTFTVTHGQYEESQEGYFIDVIAIDDGAPDEDTQTVYVAKTSVRKE